MHVPAYICMHAYQIPQRKGLGIHEIRIDPAWPPWHVHVLTVNVYSVWRTRRLQYPDIKSDRQLSAINHQHCVYLVSNVSHLAGQ